MKDRFIRFVSRLAFLTLALLVLGAITGGALENFWESEAVYSAYNRCRANTLDAAFNVRFAAALEELDECKVRARVALREARELYWHLPFTFAVFPVVALSGSAIVLVWLAGGFDAMREHHEIAHYPRPLGDRWSYRPRPPRPKTRRR
jgi:hypothetical protein